MFRDLSEQPEGRGFASSDQDSMASFFLAADLVLEDFATALRALLPPRVENIRPSCGVDSVLGRAVRGDGGEACAGQARLETAVSLNIGVQPGPPETSAEAMAARCAILLLLDRPR